MQSSNVTNRCTGVLARLRRDARGNTLAIMAAMLVPLIAFSGSAIDMARLYVVKVRLQQACDAGVLAGRKSLSDTSSSSTTLDSGAATQAQAFFKNNFVEGWYQTTNVAFTPTKTADGSGSTAANTVVGAATATVPMLVMGFFKVPPKKIDVACQARFDLADNDIMFVLDTTGSMSCKPEDSDSCVTGSKPYTRGDGTPGWYSEEKSGSKLDALRNAVLQFDTVMRDNADASSHFRYGFVPYSANVNVGRIIPSANLQNTTWKYQTRSITSDYQAVGNVTAVSASYAECMAKRVPMAGWKKNITYLQNGSTNVNDAKTLPYFGFALFTGNVSWQNAYGGACSGTATIRSPVWTYARGDVDISGFVTGNYVTTPGRLDGATSKWQGCIEELDTATGSNFSVENLPDDLDPDITTGKWRPAWPEVVWRRETTPQNLNEGDFREDVDVAPGGDANFSMGPTHAGAYGAAPCGMPAQKLKPMSADDVKKYVNDVDFKANGSTYHDIGMIWGVRMLAPKGVFGSTTAAWPGRNDPSRSIIFLTDGTMSTNVNGYGLYGIEKFDGRVNGGDTSKEAANHTARFRLMCDAAKARGITVYVVALGTATTADLDYCASSKTAYYAKDKAKLGEVFETIATKIAMLRLTK